MVTNYRRIRRLFGGLTWKACISIGPRSNALKVETWRVIIAQILVFCLLAIYTFFFLHYWSSL
jgi:hypothetical protein